ncbi:type VII secretion target [Glycomyces buryatensis]|uniref:PE domain-containing protein n=1 Tax=Glycomyces buryatensis TaxID=2570927 RepID=A0A4V6T6P9_9ACTN|nr:type VII secretion target [Glycomyces buryatensis]THV40806.1 PE domain-containing protein [Glycomyces buryatensis]
MSDRLSVDPEDLRTHTSHIQGLIERFEAVRSASTAITQADDAFGPLCEWIAPILEEKHAMVDARIDQGKRNLEGHVTALNATAESYEDADASAASDLDNIAGEL